MTDHHNDRDALLHDVAVSLVKVLLILGLIGCVVGLKLAH